MKQFFGGCLGAFLGVLIGIIILSVVIFAAITKSVSDVMDSKKIKVERKYSKESPVLKLKLEGEIKDVANKDVWNFNFRELLNDKDLILSEIIRSIDVAATDEKIKGIYIRMYPFSASISQLEELRKALQNFKKSGKWIYVYADNFYSQGDYYLASVADKIILNPQGNLFWKGLAAQISFYKKALEKLDIQIQVFRHGKFKSAVEPFTLDKMSEENRQQMRTLLNSVWKDVLQNVSNDRSIPIASLNKYADELTIRDANLALSYKMIDEIANEDEVEQMILNKVKTNDAKKVFVDYHKYKHKAKEKYDEESSKKIAVVYATGQIVDYVDDYNSNEVIVPSKLIKILKDVQNDNSIKAVVLRVNSPGGSAFASESIWQAIKKLKSTKPVIMSFGSVAASGGYYISCGADYIFTDHNTITGSIGVFGIFPNVQQLMEKDLGITTDTVKTNKYADFPTILRPVQPKEYDAIMHGIEKVYETFLSRVSEGRKLNKNYIDSIGQGRVWSGADAVKLKLADEIGTLENAIAFAAKKANLDEFDIEEYPKPKDPFQQIFEGLNTSDEATQEKILKNTLGKNYKDILLLKNALKNQQVNYLSLLPYQIELY